jgi:suppressor for copper-sensitivity B
MKKTLSVIILCLLAGTAHAAESPWVSADYAQARLIAGASMAGLEVRLAPGWHAYWRMPGDGGLAPQLDWAQSKNLKEAKVQWPTPQRYEDAELQSFGYEGQFIMPLTVTAVDAAQPVDLSLALNLMVCEKICVPQNLQIALRVPPGEADGEHDARLAAVKLPAINEAEQLKIENMVIGPDAMVARIYAPRGFEKLDMFVDAGETLYVTARPEVTVDAKDPHYAMVRVAAPQGTDNLFNAISGKKISVVVTDGAEAIEKEFSF